MDLQNGEARSGSSTGSIEDLEESKRLLQTQLDASTQREESLRDEARNLERSMALLRHELKEAQRKGEIELEAKKNMENTLHDLKRKLEEEHNKRSREMSNNQQTNERISVLEKQVSTPVYLESSTYVPSPRKSVGKTVLLLKMKGIITTCSRLDKNVVPFPQLFLLHIMTSVEIN